MGASSTRSLVGRARELGTLREALESIAKRPHQVVVLTGEPGIGKSALLAHLGQRAPQHGAVVRSGRASEFEADLPHALWREALGDAVVWDSGRGDRHGLHTAMREGLEHLAADAPLVLCLDDVHWADPASLVSLNYAPPPNGVPGGKGVPFHLSTPAGGFLCRMLSRGSDFVLARCQRGKAFARIYDHRDCCASAHDDATAGHVVSKPLSIGRLTATGAAHEFPAAVGRSAEVAGAAAGGGAGEGEGVDAQRG